jgi:glycopeptide antibiotics resistance protein
MVFIVAILLLLLKTDGRQQHKKRLLKKFLYYFLRCCALAYYALMIYILFFARRRQRNFNYRDKANFSLIYHKYQIYHSNRLLTNAGPAHFFIDLLGNVVLFIPFATAIHFLSYKKVTDIDKILIILTTSICIEGVQYAFNVGVFDVDDILLNLIGGVIGLLIFNLFRKIRRRLLRSNA